MRERTAFRSFACRSGAAGRRRRTISARTGVRSALSSPRIDFEQVLYWYESVEIAVFGDLRIDLADVDECGATALDALRLELIN